MLLVGGMILWSCTKDEAVPTAQKGTMSLKVASELPDCETACLQDGPFEQVTTSFTRQWAQVSQFTGYFKNNKYFTTTAWNDETKFSIKVDVFGYQYDQNKVSSVWTLTGPTYNNYPFTTVIIKLNGVEYTYSMDDPETDVIETATTFTKDFPLPEGWEACTEMVYTVRIEGDGQPVWLGTENTPANVTYGLYALCGCDYAMTGAVECNGYLRTATFTYTPKEDGWLKIQGGLTAGAINVVWAPTGYENLNSNASVGGWEGDVTACTTYTFIVTWEYEKYNGQGVRIMEDGNVIGDWTAMLYTAEGGTLVSGMQVDEMVCGDEDDGYIIFPVEDE